MTADENLALSWLLSSVTSLMSELVASAWLLARANTEF